MSSANGSWSNAFGPGWRPPAGDPTELVIGIGDDAAVVQPSRGRSTVLTTDAQVEGVHFDRRFSSLGDIGARALAVNLSDLAAMGATPRWALLSLALPDDLEVDEVEALATGLAEAGATPAMSSLSAATSREVRGR